MSVAQNEYVLGSSTLIKYHVRGCGLSASRCLFAAECEDEAEEDDEEEEDKALRLLAGRDEEGECGDDDEDEDEAEGSSMALAICQNEEWWGLPEVLWRYRDILTDFD